MFYKFVLKRVRTRSLEKPKNTLRPGKRRKTSENTEKKNRTKHKILFCEYVVIALRYYFNFPPFQLSLIALPFSNKYCKNYHMAQKLQGRKHTSGYNYPLLALTLSQTTNFRLFQTQRVCRRQFQIC